MLEFIFSPMVFFERRPQRPPNWPLAFLPLVLCISVQIVSGLLFVEKVQPVMAALTGRLSADVTYHVPFEVLSFVLVPFGYAVTYAMAMLALLCLDVLTKDSRRGVRLAEFVGFSFFTQLPYAIVTVVIAYLWSAGEVGVDSGASLQDIRMAVERQQAAMATSPLLSTGRLLSYYSTIWFVALLSGALKAVTGLRTRAVLAAAAFLLTLFVGIRLLGHNVGF